MHNFSADAAAATQTYSDGSCQEKPSVLPDHSQCEKGTDEFPAPLETDQVLPEGEAEREKEIISSDDSEEAHQFDASGATASLPPSPLLPTAPESEQVAYAPPSIPDGAAPSKEIPNLEEMSDPSVALSENHHRHDTITSDAVVLDSDDALPIQQISDGTSKDKNIEQNPKNYASDEASPSVLSDYIEYESADTMPPLSSNDLHTESSKPGDLGEISAGDHDERAPELENQSKLSLGQSLPGIPAPTLVSSASHVPVGQIVIHATVDPTQENAVSTLQILKVSFRNSLLFN
jgi:hypothetical protein